MANRLASESSPYLLQHADNPVDWYPWSDEAFELARTTGKPVLLSIGYSACHWCHVMAHESFEDEESAKVMNELYVNIKVDREERPDVDKIYQTAHQLLTQRGGGWPLTMFINPEDQRPFFGGTYFPKEARYGMPAFTDLLQSVATYFNEQRDDVRSQGDRLLAIFSQLDPKRADADVELSDAPIREFTSKVGRDFDREYGGIGTAPKFPHPTTISALMRHWRASANAAEPDLDALFMATLTLTRMAEGGLFDHLGGGFCRYSVDRYWQIPHFEKMLYDNGPLLANYAEAWLATGDVLFRDTANATADWMLADMQAPNGGFYSTRDADSEGEEGRFYVWTPDQVAGLIYDKAYTLFAARFGLDQEANFEGNWHLTVRRSVEDIAEDSGLSVEAARESLEASRQILFDSRQYRVEPGRDEKQLCAWNALAIRGLAIAGRALQREDLVSAASDAVDFVREHLYQDGRLLATWKDGQARYAAYLDDYAFLLDALLELLQARWRTSDLELACELAETLLAQFEDPDNGGFYFTANDAEQLIHRSKPMADDALPSGNGVALHALQRLGFLLGETRYLDATERGLQQTWLTLSEYPQGHVSLMRALEEYLAHPEIIIIRGAPDTILEWQDNAGRLYAPSRMLIAIDENADSLPGALADRKPVPDETVAYRCVGSHCELPIKTWQELARALD